MSETQLCPKCGEECLRDEVDVGVGIIYGPWGCPCGWSSDPRYDSSGGRPSPAALENPEWFVDSAGGMVRKSALKESIKEKLNHFGLDGQKVINEVFNPDIGVEG